MDLEKYIVLGGRHVKDGELLSEWKFTKKSVTCTWTPEGSTQHSKVYLFGLEIMGDTDPNTLRPSPESLINKL